MDNTMISASAFLVFEIQTVTKVPRFFHTICRPLPFSILMRAYETQKN